MKYSDFIGFKNAKSELMEVLRDNRGAQRTGSLFIEVIQPSSVGKYEPLYSLKNYDSRGLPSAYLIYMSAVDETDAALKLVGSLAHWRKLCGLKWFMNGLPNHGFDGLASWRRDMSDRDRSEAKRVLLEQCREGSVTAARALKNVADESHKPEAVSKGTKKSNSKEVVSEVDVEILNVVDRFKKQ